jgi:hypothetical protein
MNNGIRLSGTRFCHFLNCGDTFYEPYVIERTINALRVGTSSLYIWGFNYSSESLINDARPLTLKDVLSYRNSYCHQSQVISTHLLQKWFFRTDLELCSDFLMTIQILSDYDSDSLGFIGVNYQGLGFSHGKFPDIIYEKRRCILIWYTSLGLIRKVSQFPFFLMGILWNGHPQLFRLMHWLLR